MIIQSELEQAEAAIQAKDYSKARSILRKVLEQEPRNVDAWLLFAEAAQKPEHTLQCLERVLVLEPGNPVATMRLEQLQTIPPGEASKAQEISPDTMTSPVIFPTNSQPLNDNLAKTPEIKAPSPSKKPKTPITKLEKVLIGILIVISICMLSVLGVTQMSGGLLGVGNKRPSPTPTDYTAVIYENIRASNAEDKQAYMATIHPDSPAYKVTEDSLDTIFNNYDLMYKISNVSVVEENKREVKITFTLITRKIRGPDFRDNQVDGIIILRKDGATWKIYNQTVENIKYLD